MRAVAKSQHSRFPSWKKTICVDLTIGSSIKEIALSIQTNLTKISKKIVARLMTQFSVLMLMDLCIPVHIRHGSSTNGVPKIIFYFLFQILGYYLKYLVKRIMSELD